MGVIYDKAISACICTASKNTAGRLRRMLLRWASAECIALSVHCSGNVAASWADPDAQLLILDLDTVELPEKMAARKEEMGLIVISGDAGRAIYSYRLHPTAFLKPDFDPRRLADALSACEKFWSPGRLGLESPYRRRSFRLPLGRIRYVESEAHYCRFNQGKTDIRLRFSIDELEKQLPCPPFIRCHRSYLVHLGDVTGMTYTSVALRGTITLSVGRTYVQSLRSALKAWQGGEDPHDDFDFDL